MIKKKIYSSINEEGLLKSIGPFRIIQSDKSISGLKHPNEIVNQSIILGQQVIYGKSIFLEKKILGQK